MIDLVAEDASRNYVVGMSAHALFATLTFSQQQIVKAAAGRVGMSDDVSRYLLGKMQLDARTLGAKPLPLGVIGRGDDQTPVAFACGKCGTIYGNGEYGDHWTDAVYGNKEQATACSATCRPEIS